MEIEKQRGISVATSVMGFDYADHHINILDTPGHQDFAEDTFRTLTAVDSAIVVIDSAKGVETQTRRLMEVCRMRKTPVMVFMNKMDREGKDPFDLMDEVERELQIKVDRLAYQSGPFKGDNTRRMTCFPDKQRDRQGRVDIDSQDLQGRWRKRQQTARRPGDGRWRISGV